MQDLESPRRSRNSTLVQSFTLLLLVSLVPSLLAQEFTGQWLMEFKTAAEPVRLTLRYENERGARHDTSRGIQAEQLQGLSREQALSSAGSTARFQIKRDAGSLQCEGWFKEGKGAGHFSFSPSTEFVSELKRRGLQTPSAEQQFSLALHDVGLAVLDELKTQEYARPTLEQFVKLGTHGVSLEYIKGLGSLGYKLQSVDGLIRMRDHGVSLEFIKELRVLGYQRLSADEVVKTRDHGATGRNLTV